MKIFKYSGNGHVKVIEAEKISLDELKDAWLDLKTDDLPENIFGIKIEKNLLNEDEYCQVEDGVNYTLVKISYIGKDMIFKTIYFFVTPDAIITLHKEDSTPINRFIKNINAIVKDEKENIIKFNNFVLAELLYQIVDENMNVISSIDDRLQELRNSVERNNTNTNSDILNTINKIRGDIKTFSRVLLYQSAAISSMRRGEGEYILNKTIEYYAVDMIPELDKYGKLSTGLEKELNGIIQAIESRNLTAYTKYTANLSVAIELLTRASVLFMIPNSIFTLWTSIFRQEILIFGVPDWIIELLIATISVIIGQLAISHYYKKIKEVKI